MWLKKTKCLTENLAVRKLDLPSVDTYFFEAVFDIQPCRVNKRLKVVGAENQIPSICREIPEYSGVLMDFCGCKTHLGT